MKLSIKKLEISATEGHLLALKSAAGL